jgi:outer membrane protein
MKRITILTLLLLLPLAASAQLKVGIMNPDDVLDAMPEAAQVQADLESFAQERQSAFQQRYRTWIEEVTAYSEQVEAGEISEAEQAAEEERLAEMQEEVTNMQQNLEREIQQRQAELFNPLLIKVEDAMAEVAEEMGLDFVLNKTSNTGDPIVYYASERATDITQQVIEKLN